MICIVTSLPAVQLRLIYMDVVIRPVQRLFCFCAGSAIKTEREWVSAWIAAIPGLVDIKKKKLGSSCYSPGNWFRLTVVVSHVAAHIRRV